MKKLRYDKLLIFSLIFFVFPTILASTLFNFICILTFPKVLNSDQNIYCRYNVYPCDTNLFRSEIDIYIENNIVIFNQIESSHCFPPLTDPDYFTFELTHSDNNITIKEIYKPKDVISLCLCDYKIAGEIHISQNGSYCLKFVFENKLLNQIKVLGIFNFKLHFP
ncbi:MAG: hypothetical protein ACFE9S_04180 [Candidatus Hermodarchaeota archaeon]